MSLAILTSDDGQQLSVILGEVPVSLLVASALCAAIDIATEANVQHEVVDPRQFGFNPDSSRLWERDTFTHWVNYILDKHNIQLVLVMKSFAMLHSDIFASRWRRVSVNEPVLDRALIACVHRGELELSAAFARATPAFS